MTNQYNDHDEINVDFKAGDSCYYSVQILLSSRLLSKDLKIKKYKTIFPVVLSTCQTWSLTSMVAHRLSVFKNRISRR